MGKKEKRNDENDEFRVSERSGSRLELESLKIEYRNLFDRSNKLDNKVYITITFCGFLFVFITGLFSGISKIVRPDSGWKLMITVFYILTCIAVMVSYAYLLVYFMRLLQPEKIIRMDPELMEQEHLEECSESEACERLIALYRRIINEDLGKLKHRCDEFTKGLRFVVPTVILAFLNYTFQLILQTIG